MIKCQTCGTQNLDSSQYCDECGDSLQKYKAPSVGGTPEEEKVASGMTSRENPVYQSANVTSVGMPPIADEKEVKGTNGKEEGKNKSSSDDAGDSKSTTIHANLVIEKGNSIGTEFALSASESNIGRWDADNGIFPDVDLDSYDPEAKVSRKHARISFRNGDYFLEDLGSTNGTFVNRGRRLIPGNPHKINEGDEIIVGKTFLRFRISE